MGMLSFETAKILIEKAFAATEDGDAIHFLFQGGEPTMAGLDFFRFFCETEQSFHCNRYVSHSIQTNGVLLNEAWASFFKEHAFLVGLSLDGTRALHDLYRTDARGRGTFDSVLHALSLLDGCGVETNLLCVVTGQAAEHAEDVWRGLCATGPHNLQFIPCIDSFDNEKSDFSLTAERYGAFLCSVFDLWYQELKNGTYISVRNFEDYLRILLNLPPASCASSGSCGHYLTVEGDGSLYPCDFYVLDEWKLGNLRECSVEDALRSPLSRAFLAEGKIRPAECSACPYFSLCLGGCRRDFDASSKNRFCDSYRRFFFHALPRLKEAARLLNPLS